MIPANRPTTAACAAIILGTFLLVAIPPLGILLYALAIVPQMIHRDRAHRDYDRRLGAAQHRQEQEKTIAAKSLGL